MTSADEREGLLLSALQEVVGKFAVHPEFAGGTTLAGGVIVVRFPDHATMQRSFLAGGPPEDRREQVDQWLREQLVEVSAFCEPLMLGTVSTATLVFDLGTPQAAVHIAFEDHSGTFFIGLLPYELRDGTVQWGTIRAGDGFDAAHRLWPAPAPRPPPPHNADNELLGDLASAAEAIDAYHRTGFSVYALDDAIGTLEACVRRYAWDSDDERYAAFLVTLSKGLLLRFRRLGDPSDVERSIRACRELTADRPDSALGSDAYETLVLALTAEHHRTGQPAPLDEAVEIGEHRLEALGDTVADPDLTVALAQALLDRHLLYGVNADGERAKAIIMDMDRVSWNDVDWAPPAFYCLYEVYARSEGADPAVAFRNADIAFTFARRRGFDGDDIYRYWVAFGREMLAASEREPDASHLLNLLATTENLLGLDEPGETPRLAKNAPARVPVMELWVEALGSARRRGDPLLDRFDPDGSRLLSACEELVRASGSAAPRRAVALYRLAAARRALGDRAGAVEAGREAIAAWEDVFARAATAERLGRGDLGSELYRRCFRDLLAQLQDGPQEALEDGLWEALLLAEAPKSRMLAEAVGRADLPAPAMIPADLIARERALVGELSVIDEHDLAVETDQARIRTPREASIREELRSDLDAVWDEIAALDADAAEYVAVRRGRPPDRARLQQLLAALPAGTTVVSVVEADGVINLVFASGESTPLGVTGFALSPEDGAATVERMWREIPMSQGRDRGATWLDRLAPLLDKLMEVTRDAYRLIVTPHGSTRSLPWSVIERELERRRGKSISIVVEPALSLLEVLWRRTFADASPDLVAGDPLGDLAFARDEAVAVGRRLGVKALIGPAATVKAVAAAAPTARIIHLAAHAQFAAEDPLGSSVRLADGAWTARDMIATTLASQLVVLSACESGRAVPLRGDEVAGLSMAILHAGAARVIVTLWPVDDRAALLYMEALYEALEDPSIDCDRAVGRAARAVEAEPGFAHPYYWGGYVLHGDYTWGPDRALKGGEDSDHAASGT